MVAFLILHVQKANQAAGAAEAGADGAAPPADDGPIDDGQGPMVQRGGGRLDNGRVEPRRPLPSSAPVLAEERVVCGGANCLEYLAFGQLEGAPQRPLYLSAASASRNARRGKQLAHAFALSLAELVGSTS